MTNLRKAQGVAYTSSGLFSASQAVLFVMYPIISERLGLSLSTIIACFSLGSFLFLWGGPYWALKSDHSDRGTILKITQLGVLLSLIALILLFLPLGWSTSASFVVLLLSRVLYGSLASGLVSVSQALVMDYSEGREKTKAAATHSMFLNIGRFLGPVIGLSVAFIGPIWLLGFFASLTFALILLQPKMPTIQKSASLNRKSRFLDLWPKTKEMQGVIALALLTTIFLGILQSSLAAFLVGNFNQSSESASHEMAKLLILAALTTVIVQGVMRSRIKNPWQGTLPVGGLCVLAGNSLLLFGQGLLWIYPSILIMATGIALITPSYTSAMSHFQTEGQGKAAGALSLAHTLGYALGGGLSSLALLTHASATFWVAMIISFLVFATLPAIYSAKNLIQTLSEADHVET